MLGSKRRKINEWIALVLTLALLTSVVSPLPLLSHAEPEEPTSAAVTDTATQEAIDEDEAQAEEEPAPVGIMPMGSIGVLAAGEAEVSTWDQFKAAYNDQSIHTIYFKNNITYTGSKTDSDNGLFTARTAALTIDGRGYTLDFGSQVDKGL
ncbi:MAG: hypothetical protein LBR14_02300, partial [Clostridiales Family XIII bacterium]|nr:hypothetical protein [Clostridiales Family XIII bacterium]